jgi:hypothetical protein
MMPPMRALQLFFFAVVILKFDRMSMFARAARQISLQVTVRDGVGGQQFPATLLITRRSPETLSLEVSLNGNRYVGTVEGRLEDLRGLPFECQYSVDNDAVTAACPGAPIAALNHGVVLSGPPRVRAPSPPPAAPVLPAELPVACTNYLCNQYFLPSQNAATCVGHTRPEVMHVLGKNRNQCRWDHCCGAISLDGVMYPSPPHRSTATCSVAKLHRQ